MHLPLCRMVLYCCKSNACVLFHLISLFSKIACPWTLPMCMNIACTAMTTCKMLMFECIFQAKVTSLPTTIVSAITMCSFLFFRTYKKRCQARLRKHLGDLCLLAGLPGEALLHYQTSLDVLKSASDWMWLGGRFICYSKIHLKMWICGSLASLHLLDISSAFSYWWGHWFSNAFLLAAISE